MKPAFTLVLCIAAFLFGGASTCQKPTPPTNPIVAGVVNCAEEGVHKAAVGIIDDVASAVATGDYVASLEKLVKDFGEGAVDCAVREVATTSDKHAALDELEMAKATRAKNWLNSRSVKFGP